MFSGLVVGFWRNLFPRFYYNSWRYYSRLVLVKKIIYGRLNGSKSELARNCSRKSAKAWCSNNDTSMRYFEQASRSFADPEDVLLSGSFAWVAKNRYIRLQIFVILSTIVNLSVANN